MDSLGLVLAGGQSRRMGGRAKALLPPAGRTMIEHAVARLAPQVAEIPVSANDAPPAFAPWWCRCWAMAR